MKINENNIRYIVNENNANENNKRCIGIAVLALFCRSVYAASLLLERFCEGRICDEKIFQILVCSFENESPKRGTHIALLPS